MPCPNTLFNYFVGLFRRYDQDIFVPACLIAAEIVGVSNYIRKKLLANRQLVEAFPDQEIWKVRQWLRLGGGVCLVLLWLEFSSFMAAFVRLKKVPIFLNAL